MKKDLITEETFKLSYEFFENSYHTKQRQNVKNYPKDRKRK